MNRLFIGLILLGLVSCSSNENKIIGKWKLDNIDYSEFFKEAPAEVKSIIESQMEEEFERLKDKTFFTFSDDQKVTLEAPNFVGKTTLTAGSFKMNDNLDSLFLQLSDPENYQIVSLDDKFLILKTSDSPKRTLQLSKVNQ